MSGILIERDTNAHMANQPENEKLMSLEYHRQVLESRLKSGQAQQAYTSPSDNIQSPATQKLNAFKTKHSMKKSKPQTLFAKTSTKNLQTAAGTAMFADIPKSDTAKGS